MSKKTIIIRVVFYAIILLVVGWSLNGMIDANVRLSKYRDLYEHSHEIRESLEKRNASLSKENEFLRMRLNEYGYSVLGQSAVAIEGGFWTVKLASYINNKNDNPALDEVLRNVFIKNKMFDVLFRMEHDNHFYGVMVLCYGRYKTQIEAIEQLDKLKALHKDFANCEVEKFHPD